MGLKHEIIITSSPRDLAHTAALHLCDIAEASVKNRNRFVLAISGGATPRAMHRLLSDEPYISRIPWDASHIFWVDERCVPYSAPESNYGSAKIDLLDRVPLPEDQIHPIPVLQTPEEGAYRYERNLKDLFRRESEPFPVFDLIFLGLGMDGHTASLFPGHESLDQKKRLVVSVLGGNPLVRRITLTLPVLNRARHIAFLISGKEKASITKAVLEIGNDHLPAKRVHPSNGRVTWLLDRASASMLAEEYRDENF